MEWGGRVSEGGKRNYWRVVWEKERRKKEAIKLAGPFLTGNQPIFRKEICLA